MLNEKLVRWIKLGAIGFLLLFMLALGYAVGGIGKQASSTSKNKEQRVAKTLTQQHVEDFLLVYFTKKDLEENRSRYKPFMTEGAYNQEISIEEEATNQAYKGYVVNQEFKEATIYIDDKNLIALVEVRYTNDILKTKGSDEDALKGQSTRVSLKLSYLKEGDQLLVNQISSIVITDSANPEGISLDE